MEAYSTPPTPEIPGSGDVAVAVQHVDMMLAAGVNMSDAWNKNDPITSQYTRDVYIPILRHIAAIKSILNKNGVPVTESLLGKVE